jgi:DNA replication protein DnaC
MRSGWPRGRGAGARGGVDAGARRWPGIRNGGSDRNLLLIGPTGIGKSWLGEAFAERACRAGYSAYCARASRLFHELHVARGDGSYTRVLARLAKTDLLVIDLW